MKAVILVGGEGTRMRPLTETTPKPLLPLVDRPGLDHVLDHLARHGVHEVVLSSPYLEATFHPFIESRRGDPSITWIVEDAPLGTGGAIVHAVAALGSEPFFALNGDILTDLDLTAMAAFHRERSAAVTIALHHVEDARAFGLVETDERGRVLAFREKPTDLMPGDVNAGTYLIDPAVLGAWTSDRQISIEREIFPQVIADGHAVVGFPAEAYWMDLGTPEKYLQAHFDLLERKVRGRGVHRTVDRGRRRRGRTRTSRAVGRRGSGRPRGGGSPGRRQRLAPRVLGRGRCPRRALDPRARRPRGSSGDRGRLRPGRRGRRPGWHGVGGCEGPHRRHGPDGVSGGGRGPFEGSP